MPSKGTTTRVQIEGIQELIAQLGGITDDLKGKTQARVKSSTEAIYSDASRNVAVKSGALKESIHTSYHESGLWGRVRAGGAGAKHAPLVELGTSKMAAKPFLRPAWDGHKEQFANGVIEDFENAVKANSKG